ncbi:hypothetical protein F442_05406 [Phytophthora nicotianae P10297]|uniref:Uncharacterized protein n=1 Tax=Phytophthora nicotianae P10297 TaxID=1317064 RepID=W2ZPL2_PHYNI|nr:hypothetical protein F442_05406 [Phytophthora nicotianae P10297]
MDAILARVGVSDTALRAHCSNAVHDELQQAEKRLQKALAALKRALEVAEASRELHKSSQALVDESPDVSSMLSRVVSSCNAIGPLTRKLHQTVSSPAAAANEDANSSATEDEGEMQLHEIIDLVDERDEPGTEPSPSHREESELLNPSSSRAGHGIPTQSTPHEPHSQPRTADGVIRVIRPFARAPRGRSKPLPPRRPSTRKRKAPEHYLAPVALPPVKKFTRWELLEKRLALGPQGEYGEMIHSCLLAARDSLLRTGISKLQSTCHELADAKDRGV